MSAKILKSVDECRRYSKSKQCRFRDTVYSMTEKNSGVHVHVSLGSGETLVRRSGITNHRLIAYSISNISAKKYQNRLMYVKVIVRNTGVVF